MNGNASKLDKSSFLIKFHKDTVYEFCLIMDKKVKDEFISRTSNVCTKFLNAVPFDNGKPSNEVITYGFRNKLCEVLLVIGQHWCRSGFFLLPPLLIDLGFAAGGCRGASN